jgi:hypothetical protein
MHLNNKKDESWGQPLMKSKGQLEKRSSYAKLDILVKRFTVNYNSAFGAAVSKDKESFILIFKMSST